MVGKLRVGVAVCATSWDRGLRQTIESLRVQDSSPDFDFSAVILIWNSARPFPNEEQLLLASLQSVNWPNLKIQVFFESQIGVPFARNRALEEAKSQNLGLLAFIDDDMVASSRWLGELVRTQRREDVFAVAGSNFIAPSAPASPWLPEGTWGLQPYPRHQISRAEKGRLHSAYTGNVLISMAHLEALPGEDFRFEPRWSREGGEDIAFFAKASSMGGRIHYCHAARTTEIYGDERLSFGWHFKRGIRNGRLRLKTSLDLGQTGMMFWRLFGGLLLHSDGLNSSSRDLRRRQTIKQHVGRVLLVLAPVLGLFLQFARIGSNAESNGSAKESLRSRPMK